MTTAVEAKKPYAAFVEDLARSIRQFKPRGVILYGHGIDCLDVLASALQEQLSNGSRPALVEEPAATSINDLTARVKEFSIVVVRDARPERPDGTISGNHTDGYYQVDLVRTLPYHAR
jgi:hypothetical protein